MLMLGAAAESDTSRAPVFVQQPGYVFKLNTVKFVDVSDAVTATENGGKT